MDAASNIAIRHTVIDDNNVLNPIYLTFSIHFSPSYVCHSDLRHLLDQSLSTLRYKLGNYLSSKQYIQNDAVNPLCHIVSSAHQYALRRTASGPAPAHRQCAHLVLSST